MRYTSRYEYSEGNRYEGETCNHTKPEERALFMENQPQSRRQDRVFQTIHTELLTKYISVPFSAS